ncbi:PIN domain-containing protein [Nostoc sphaeroides]|uniref:Putative toxin-antitoxin system toxin component n=1 Tax=Nostoc sphaeroides CCNUC1 TaxID=2653204 RepID=A0A5P8W3W7_9NOSO|nr:PIN domain-containing protein [Nostoc sphaeroides]MCC5630902.1 PIN domain-containing protein [Nostoc sphaeroides CHAB 2801]QFS46976.1 putative toxin-antitoxin system toxin component [Nostoc sphaeroides CCNUC1]
MKVIIDTNIVVSAAIADKNPEVVILFVIANSDFEWVVSAEIIAEYKAIRLG